MSRTESAARPIVLVVLAGCTIALIGFGVRSGFGLFQNPIILANNWGSEVFALALAIQNLLWGLGQPFAGMIADRYGTARVLIGGALLYAAGVALMTFASTPMELHLTAGVLIGLGLSGSSFTVVLAAFGRLVPPEKRSWAFGLGTAAGSAGQFLLAPLGQAFIAAYGWQAALLILAAIVLLIFPLALSLAGRQEDLGTAAERNQSIGGALAEAFGHPSYLLLIAGFFVCGFHVAFITVHMPKYLVDSGLGGVLAAWSISLVGLFNIIGSYLAGIGGGRYSKRYLLSSIYFLRAVVIAIFIAVPVTAVSVLLFSAAMGLLWLSTVPLTSGLVAVMFGPRYMATLFGFVFFSHQVGSFLGVWLGGRFYDQFGNYDLVWYIGIALGVFSAIVHLPIRERPVDRLLAPA